MMDFENFVASIVQEKFKQFDEDAADAREQQSIAQVGLGTRPMSDRPGLAKEDDEVKVEKLSSATRVLTDMSDYYEPDEFPTQEVRIDNAPRFSSINKATVLDILSANRDGLEKQGIIKMPMGMMRQPDPTLDIDGLQNRILDKLDLRPPEGGVQDIQYGLGAQQLGKVEGVDNEDINVDRDTPTPADVGVQPMDGKEYAKNMFTISGENVKPNMDKIKEFAINTYSNPVKAAAFVATVQAESGEGLVEKGHTKDTAIEIFVNRNARKDGTLGPKMTKRKADILALPDDYTSDDIFNIVYGGRLGNRAGTNDGSTYKGRGIIQITGRNNYKRVGDAIGVDLVNNPELLETDKDIMLRASLAYLRDSGFISTDLTQDRLASIVGHSDRNKKEAKKRWKSTQKFYKEMYGEKMPTSSRAVTSTLTSSPRPRTIKPRGIMERPPL